MTDKRGGWGNTVLGWFVEFDDKSAPAAGGKPDDAADDLIRRYAGETPAGGKAGAASPRSPARDASPAKSPSGERPPDFGAGGGKGPSVPAPDAPATPGAPIDFDPTFKKAGIGDAERDQVRKALDLLANLPAETPQPVKKQIVETSLKTFGVSIDSIIETSVAEIQALHGAIQSGAGDTQRLIADSQTRLAKLEQQMADVRQIVSQKQAEQANVESQARAYGLRVQQILEFFGQEKVGQVVKESPRLVDPKDPK